MKNETRESHLRNLERMRSNNAPTADIEAYYVREKITPAQLNVRADESGFGTQVAQGALMGGYDELAGFARSLVSGNPYDEEVSAINQGIKNYEADNTAKALAGQTLGALGTTAALTAIPGVGAGLGPASAAANASRLAMMARGIGIGAGEGAVAGALSDNEDRGRGAIQGTMMGAAFPLALNTAGVSYDIAKPLLNSEQEKIAGQLLRSVSTNPEKAIKNLQQNSEVLVPGSYPTTAQSARDPGLAAFETPVRAIDQANRLGMRNIDQQTARTEILSKMARDPDTVQGAMDKRDAAALPMLKNAFDGAGSIDTNELAGVMSVIRDQPGVRSQKTVRNAINTHIKELSELTADADGNLMPISAEDLYGLRKEIVRAMQGKLSGEAQDQRLARKQLSSIVGLIDERLESAAPGFADYLSTYAQRSKPVNQMETLQDIQMRSEVATPNLVTGDGVLSPAKLTAQLRGPAGREKLAKLSEAQRRRVNKILTDIQRSTAATAPGVRAPGSDTMKNLSIASLIGKTFGDFGDTKPAQALASRLSFLGFGEDNIQELLVQAMLDPELAARLMSQSSPRNVEGFISAAQRRLPNLFYGVTGASAGLQQQ
jgi:hypothetical protein